MEILELIIKVHGNGKVEVSDKFVKNRMGRPRLKKRKTDKV